MWKSAFLSFPVLFSDYRNTWNTQRKRKAKICLLDRFYPTVAWLGRSSTLAPTRAQVLPITQMMGHAHLPHSEQAVTHPKFGGREAMARE